MNRQVLPELAWIASFDAHQVVLRTVGFQPDQWRRVFLNFLLEDLPYFVNAVKIPTSESSFLHIEFPHVVYCAERRDRQRLTPAQAPSRVVLHASDDQCFEAAVEDYSVDGLRLRIPELRLAALDGDVRVQIPDKPMVTPIHAKLRHVSRTETIPGWVCIGLSLTPTKVSTPFPVEVRRAVLPLGFSARARNRIRMWTEGARASVLSALRPRGGWTDPATEPHVVSFVNREGEKIVAIVDSYGDTRGAPAVVIPPAWGRTKETLLPLARTILSTFAAANQPVVVLRFDGIRRRGESHNEVGCDAPGKEHHCFTFSQGVRDIQAVLDFLARSDAFRPATTTLVTFSAASIEGRRAVALEGGHRIHAWISVVGAADVQSMMRVISGGVDYVAGQERGISFGIQEILGIEVDIDRAAIDAAENGLSHLHDARLDFARITVPVTWFHGKYDAWMDLERVRDVMAQGDVSLRRLVEIPAGHQLRSSSQALEVFQAMAIEIGRVALGLRLSPAVIDVSDLRARQLAERARRPQPRRDLRGFWRQYLLGRDESAVGIELLYNTTAYRKLLGAQIEALRIEDGQRLADLGCGIGKFASALEEYLVDGRSVQIHGYDYVRSALARARIDARLRRGRQVVPSYVESDLSLADRGIPARSEAYDGVLASLLLGYVDAPLLLLREMRRILRPGGRLVLSMLKKDADISRIYRQAMIEARQNMLGASDSATRSTDFDRSFRGFLNDAARLLDLEEEGTFRFWDEEEITRLVMSTGFQRIRVFSEFGDPPQALVAVAERP